MRRRHWDSRWGRGLGGGDDWLRAVAQHGSCFSREDLAAVVAENRKQRFAFDALGTRIRSNHVYSVAVDLELEPHVPPAVLYHHTGAAISPAGLIKLRRHTVHLAADRATAEQVGTRHGRPVVFALDAVAMHAAGRLFYCATGGIWLTETVPPAYLREV